MFPFEKIKPFRFPFLSTHWWIFFYKIGQNYLNIFQLLLNGDILWFVYTSAELYKKHSNIKNGQI